MASPTQWTWVWVGSGSWWWTGRPGLLQPWGRKESDMTEQLNWLTDWTVVSEKKLVLDISLVFQRLSLYASNVGGQRFDPWSGNWIPCATIKDPTSHSEDRRSHMPRAAKLKKKKKKLAFFFLNCKLFILCWRTSD